MNYDKSKFQRGKLQMVSQPIFYVEGERNKFFYQQFEELSTINLENGGSCPSIRAKVNSQKDSYGIIDRDYLFHSNPKLFPIDYYSIENLSLIYMNRFEELKTNLIEFINLHGLNKVKNHKISLTMNLNKTLYRITDFSLELSDTHDSQFSTYIESAITCNSSFIRYSSMKHIVEKYVKFHKSKYGFKINHINDLMENIPSKSIEVLFDSETERKLKVTINSYY